VGAPRIDLPRNLVVDNRGVGYGAIRGLVGDIGNLPDAVQGIGRADDRKDSLIAPGVAVRLDNPVYGYGYLTHSHVLQVNRRVRGRKLGAVGRAVAGRAKGDCLTSVGSAEKEKD